MIRKAIKKPIEIEFIIFDGSNFSECEYEIGSDNYDSTLNYPNIKTKEGILRVSTGDYIVFGYSDELGRHCWPVKPDYFKGAYDILE
jgi:hypothetical protein